MMRRIKRKNKKEVKKGKTDTGSLVEEYYKKRDKKIITEIMHVVYNKLINEKKRGLRGKDIRDIQKAVIKGDAYSKTFMLFKDKYGYDDPVVREVEEYMESKKGEIRKKWRQHVKLMGLKVKKRTNS